MATKRQRRWENWYSKNRQREIARVETVYWCRKAIKLLGQPAAAGAAARALAKTVDTALAWCAKSAQLDEAAAIQHALDHPPKRRRRAATLLELKVRRIQSAQRDFEKIYPLANWKAPDAAERTE